jgi:hypothetical protein
MEETTCIICLDGPVKKNPLFLMKCGCKASWFHTSCERSYISTTSLPFSCPVCRRPVQLQANYSFSPGAGPEQQQLWTTACLFGFEIVYSVYFKEILLPVETLVVFCIPFMIPSNSTLDYFCTQIQIKYAVEYLIFLTQLLVKGVDLLYYPTDILRSFFAMGILQITILFIAQVCGRPLIFRDPLLPYIISNEILHADRIDYEKENES